jgi:hypothetical protein
MTAVATGGDASDPLLSSLDRASRTPDWGACTLGLPLVRDEDLEGGRPRWSIPKIDGGSPMQDLNVHQRSTGAAPSASRGTFTAFGARHVKGVALTRWIAAACFVIAGAVLFAFAQWWGVVFFLAAGLNGSLAYLVPRWNAPRVAAINTTLST